MPFESQEAVVVATLFIVPGFIIHSLRATVALRRYTEQQLWLRLFVLSLVNAAFCSSIISFFDISDRLKLLLFFVVCPIVIGVAQMVNIQFKLTDWVLKRAGFRPVDPVPSAWDWKFSQLPGPQWVVVTLKNGGIVLGRFDVNSFASSAEDERDIYIESIYQLEDDGKWGRLGKGILILKEEISSIEFQPVSPERKHGQSQQR